MRQCIKINYSKFTKQLVKHDLKYYFHCSTPGYWRHCLRCFFIEMILISLKLVEFSASHPSEDLPAKHASCCITVTFRSIVKCPENIFELDLSKVKINTIFEVFKDRHQILLLIQIYFKKITSVPPKTNVKPYVL